MMSSPVKRMEHALDVPRTGSEVLTERAAP